MCLSLDRSLSFKRAKVVWSLPVSLVLLIHCPISYAKHWTVTPGIQLGEIYTDNVGLDSSGGSRSEFISEAAPSLVIKGKGPRFQLNLNYRMQNLIYATNSAANRTYHKLKAGSKAELIGKLLYLDASAYMSQQLINPSGKIPFGNFAISSNRTNVRTYHISPYVRHSFGTTASAELRYGYTHINYSARPQYASRSNQYMARLASGPSFNRISWSLYYNREKVMYRTGRNVAFESIQGQLGWLLTRTLRLEGSVGYDKNQYISSGGRTSGKRWSVGIRWAPGPRTSLSAEYGRRYFGNNYLLEFKHRSRFTSWQASYSVRPTTSRNLQLSSQVVGLINPSGQMNLINLLVPTLTTQVYIQKRAELSAQRRLKSGSIDLRVYHVRRTFQQTGEASEYYGSRDSVSWKVSKRTNITVHGAWLKYSTNVTGRSDYWILGAGATRRISRNVNTSLRYRHVVRVNTGSGYSENMVFAYLNMTF